VTLVASPSLTHPEYWWYRARAELLRTVLEDFVGDSGLLLDVGSADGPSVDWLRGRGHRVAMDMDPRGLEPGAVCGSALELPFADATFDLVAAFDVLEHCEPEGRAVAEMARVLAAGGVLLVSVPAYMWAWTEFDLRNHHHRRYTRRRAVAALEREGLEVLRATYVFCTTFPIFAVQRLATRLRERLSRRPPALRSDVELPSVGRRTERVLLALCRLDRRLLRTRDLPVGSSVVLVARKPRQAGLGN